MRVRPAFIAVRVTDAERKSLKVLAETKRASVSDLLRRGVGLVENNERVEATGQGHRRHRA